MHDGRKPPRLSNSGVLAVKSEPDLILTSKSFCLSLMLCQTLNKLFCHNLRHSLLVFDSCFHTTGRSNYGKGKKRLKRTRGMGVSLESDLLQL